MTEGGKDNGNKAGGLVGLHQTDPGLVCPFSHTHCWSQKKHCLCKCPTLAFALVRKSEQHAPKSAWEGQRSWSKNLPFVAPATAPAPPLESQNWQTASLTQSGFCQQPWLQKQTKSSPCSALIPTLLCVSKEKVSLKVRVGLAGGSWLSGSHRLWSAPQCFLDRDQTHKVKLLFPTLCSVGSKTATVGVFGCHSHCKQQ